MNELDYRIYQYIADYVREHGYTPTRHEIANTLNIDCDSVSQQILRLWNLGYICYPPHVTNTLYLSSKEPVRMNIS